MPLYEYTCECGKTTEINRTVEKRDDVLMCGCCALMKRTEIVQTMKPVVLDGYNESIGEYVTGPRDLSLKAKAKGLNIRL